MKKALVTLAACASCGVTLAQSSVTIFGVMDAGVGRISSTGRGHATGVITGGNSTSRLGFRGTEDLGGGTSASFWLEGELQTDNGNANGFNFVRRSTVSLSGKLGELRVGRDYVASYLSMISYDAYSQRGLGVIETFGPTAGAVTTAGSALGYQRTSNGVAYFLPDGLGGLNGTVSYGFGERSSTTATTATNSKKQGDHVSGRIGYATGALDLAASYGRFFDVSRNATYVDDYNVANVGASYNFQFIKPMVFWQTERMDGRGALPQFKWNTLAIGATAPIGAHMVRASVARYENDAPGVSGVGATKVALGYVHNLSKRSVIYADVVRLNNKSQSALALGNIGGSITGASAPTPGGNSTGVAVGIRHLF